MASGVRHLSVGRTTKELPAAALGRGLSLLNARAEERGMLINAKKTQLLAISPNNGCDTTATLVGNDGEVVRSIDSLRLVGFTFGNGPGVGAHVETVEESYRRKKWMLFNLRDAGFKGRTLFRLYCCYVRSVIEYCSPVYHYMLTAGQSGRLERLHRHAVRTCFGYDRPVEEKMAEEAIETLQSRRQRRFDSFVRKSAASSRFGPLWYTQREEDCHGLRHCRAVQETRASTARRSNSPLACMRRRANNLGLVPSEG